MYDLLQFVSQESFLITLSLILLFFAVFLLFYNVLPDPDSILAIRRLGVEEALPKESKILMIKLLRPLFPLIPNKLIKLKLSGDRPNIHKKLITAKLSEELTPNEFVALKYLSTVISPLVITFLTTTFGINLPPISIPILAVVGFFYPNFWMNGRVNARKREILRSLPYTIDILTLSVEAGMDFIAALTRLIQKTKGNALTDELTQMLKEIRLGTSRSDALRNLADRLQIEDISSLATLLIQVDQFGASIGPVLRAQSDQIRTNRFYAAERAGAKASQLILIPMVLFIFPTIFLVILGPYFILYATKGLF